MATDCRIRPARTDDAESILLVHVAAILDTGPSAYTDRQVAAWAAKTEGTARYERAVADPATDLVVAVHDRSGDGDDPSGDEPAVVGFGELDYDRNEVAAVFVDPDRTGEGVGSTILADFEGRLAAAGADAAELAAVRPAVGFYEGHGYRRTERVTRRTTAGVAMTVVRMHKSL